MKSGMKFIHFTQPLFGTEEKKEVLNTLDSGWITLGPKTKQFEDNFAEYVGVKHAVAVSSNTAGMHLALIALGIKPGDEVITTPFTFVATVNVIVHVGAVPILVDVDPKTFNIDPTKIEEKITKRTKAIMPVHYGGLACDMDEVIKIAKKHDLLIIEDAAHASGASYKNKRIGAHGDVAIFSFHPVKNISTGDGGMVTTDNAHLANKISTLRLHGMSKEAWKRHSASGSWKYDVELPGFKYNMTDISASLGIHQLKKLGGFIKKRKEYADFFNKSFENIPEISTPYVPINEEHIYSLYTIKIDVDKLKIDRDEIVELLKEANIGATVYFIPVHHFTLYKNSFGFSEEDFPVTEKIFKSILSLPLYPRMSIEDVKYVADTLRRIIENNRKEYVWSIDNFDSEIFGFKTAKIKHLYSNGDAKKLQKTINTLKKDMVENEVEYAIYRAPADNYSLIQVLENNNFTIVDGLVSLSNDEMDIVHNINSKIRKAKITDLKQLKNIASTSFERTRIYNDAILDKKKAGKMYARWIENSLTQKVADEVFVWEENGEILGFITLQKSGHIPLIAVMHKARGKGIAKELIKAVLYQCKEWGITRSEIETQMANIPALRAYQSCGFKIIDSSLTFRWMK